MSDSVNPTPAASYGPTTPPVAATVVAESAHIQTGGPAAPTPKANGLGIASLIVGGVALLLAFIPFINYVSGVIALIGIVLGIVALIQKNRKKGLAIAGTAVSVVAAILSVILAVAYTAGFASVVDDAIGGASVSETAPEATDTGDASAEPTPADESSDAGTRENPLPLGSTVTLNQGGAATYDVTPGASTLDATSVIASENEFNEAAPAGMQYALLPLAFGYVGTETGTPWIDIDISFVGVDGNTYRQSDTFVSGPAPLTDINEMFPGATAQGNAVVAIPIEGAAQGVWSISPLFGDPIYFAAQ